MIPLKGINKFNLINSFKNYAHFTTTILFHHGNLAISLICAGTPRGLSKVY